MRMRRIAFAEAVLAAAVLAVAVTGCASSPSQGTATTPATPAAAAPTEVRVSAALILKKSFEQMAPAFEKANNAKLTYNFGTVGVLQKQIEGGAPTDLFASAAAKQVDMLTKAGLASAEETVAFAQNQLVIIVPAGNPAGISGPSDLAKSKRIITGDPVTTQHGAKVQEWLTKLGLMSSLKPKLVYADTLDYVAQGEADAGIVFASSAKINPKVQIVYTAPGSELKPATHVAVPIKASKQQELAKKFIDYLVSPEGQKILVENGFMPAP
jgi:molybdate transport system substrate-binding protein